MLTGILLTVLAIGILANLGELADEAVFTSRSELTASSRLQTEETGG